MTLPSREEVRSAYRHLDFTKSDKRMFAKVLNAYINGELVEKMSEDDLTKILIRVENDISCMGLPIKEITKALSKGK